MLVITFVSKKVKIMPVETKDKLLQVRIPQDLYDRFCVVADMKKATVSACVRGLMCTYIEQVERRTRSNEEWAATLASRAAAASAAKPEEKRVVVPLKQSEGPLARKRREEKEAKDARRAQKMNRY